MADKPEFLEMEGSGHDIVMSEEETGDKGKGKRKESGDESSAQEEGEFSLKKYANSLYNQAGTLVEE